MKKLFAVFMCLIMCLSFISCKSKSKDIDKDKNTPSKAQSNSSETEKTDVIRPEKVTKIFPFESKLRFPYFIPENFYDSKNGNILPYRLYVPKDYNAKNQYPVILFLHGAGEIGVDNQSQLSNIDQMFKINGDFATQAIVICPQSNEWWNLDREMYGDRKGTLASAMNLLDEIQKTYSCDKNRIYVTGISMGGYATWNLLEEYGDVFAAGIPICGGGNTNNASKLIDIPIRIYHSTDDTTVPFSLSQNMYDAIVNAGGKKVKLVTLYSVGHNSWDTAYSDRDTLSWLFAQNKAKNKTGKYEKTPYFQIVDKDGKIVIQDEDIRFLFYDDALFGAKDITVEVVLNNSGKEKLEKLYKENQGKQFTVYWADQKLYTFSVNGMPVDDTFAMVGIFDYITAKNFCESFEGIKD